MCPRFCIIALHASWSCRPAAEWMALSIQPYQGQKHPSRAELAALTMASARRRVMSPLPEGDFRIDRHGGQRVRVHNALFLPLTGQQHCAGEK